LVTIFSDVTVLTRSENAGKGIIFDITFQCSFKPKIIYFPKTPQRFFISRICYYQKYVCVSHGGKFQPMGLDLPIVRLGLRPRNLSACRQIESVGSKTILEIPKKSVVPVPAYLGAMAKSPGLFFNFWFLPVLS
jgi:hypothetical protein